MEIYRSGKGSWRKRRSIYPCLHYLEAEKQVSSQRREVDGRNRNYYKVTARGWKRLEASSSDWIRVTTGVSLLMGEPHAWD